MSIFKKTPSEKERRRIEDAERLRRQREETARRAPCEKHPSWTPFQPGPPVPSHMCPYCRREAMRNRGVRRPVREVAHPLNCGPARLDLAWQLWKEQHPERVGIEPGSPAESRALEALEDLRFEEHEREAAKSRGSGYVAIERIEGGQVVQYIAPPRRGRKGALGLERRVLE